MSETEILRLIRDCYGRMIEAAARLHRHRPEVLAGIMMCETEGGTSRLLDRPGPEGRGDSGHGHGLMQIDDRSFSGFCASQDWKDPDNNIHFGAWVLARKRAFLAMCTPDADLERASIAAYNCGEGNVLKQIRSGKDVDARTTHADYSREVLRFAEIYSHLAKEA